MPNEKYRHFVQRLNRQNQFAIQYDPDAMARAIELDGVTNQPGRVNVLVAGTNGKGSISSYLHALCHAAGLRVGLYTSPHLVSFRERIRVNGQAISEDEVVRLGADLFERYGDEAHSENVRTLSYFELTTLLALRYFESVDALDVCVFEVGLGGRLDATNVVDPQISCFGSISLDHQNLLGDTIEEIAREKAGIARAGVPAFVHRENGGNEVLAEALVEHDAQICFVEHGPHDVVGIERRQEGSAAHRNRELAVAAFCEAAAMLDLDKQIARSAIRRAPLLARWPGRQAIEVVGQRRFLLDGAHNIEAMHETADWLMRILGDGLKVPVIMGVSGSRDLEALMAPIRPWARELFIADHAGESAASAQEMCARWDESRSGISVTPFDSVDEAISALQSPTDCIICGSLYLVGDAYVSLGYGESQIPSIIERT